MSSRSKRRGTKFARNGTEAAWAGLRGSGAFATLLLAFLLALVLFGGSSRYDQLAQIPVRVIAILVIAAATFRSTAAAPRALRIPAVLLGTAITLVCVQLTPLPPSFWIALPNRSAFAEAAAAGGFEQPWRPLAIAPDLAVNSLLALTVPAAALYGLAALDPGHRRWIYPALLVVVAVSLGVGLVQLTTGSGGFTAIYELQWRQTASGVFANRNHQALLLAAGVPLLAGWEELQRRDRRGVAARWGAGAMAALLVVALVATGSRAGLLLGLLGLLGGLAVIRSWGGRRGRTPRRPAWVVPAALAASVASLIGTTIFFGRGEAIDRLLAADPLGDKRARALPTVLELLGSYFPAGSGFGSFDAAFRRAEPFDLLETTYFNQAHNDLLQVVIEGGAPGFVLLTAAVGWLGVASAGVWRGSGARGTAAWRTVVRARAATIALLLTLVSSAADYPLRTPIMMAVACALIFQIAAALDELGRPPARPLDADGRELALPDL